LQKAKRLERRSQREKANLGRSANRGGSGSDVID